MGMATRGRKEVRELLDGVREQLRRSGLDVEVCCPDAGDVAVKVVCVAADLGESLRSLGSATRDHVVMARVDGETSRALDAWVETGHVKSRSEAGALFIREGVRLRAAELARLEGALRAVHDAKTRLREQARHVFGEEGD